MFQAMCSAKVSAPTQRPGKGVQWWRRDVHHVVDSDTMKTMCGRDASEWLAMDAFDDIDAAMASDDCCQQCVRAREREAWS